MTRTMTILKTLTAALSLALAASTASAQTLIPLKDLGQPNLGQGIIGKPVITGRIGINCPAPAVQSITARRLVGNQIRIEAVIKNVGGLNWTSNRFQQAAMIGDAFGNLGTKQDFTNLPAGNSFTLTMQTTWNPAHEFPSGFTASIAYDPDIYIDGNPANDDCRRGDNARTITPAEINALFR